MIEWLAGKIAGPLFAGLSALLLVTCIVLGVTVHNLRSDKAALTDRIENPETGYIARLATVRGNLTRCNVSIEESDARTAKAKADGEAAVAELERQREATIAPLRGQLAAAKADIARLIMPVRNPGESACERASRLIREEVQ